MYVCMYVQWRCLAIGVRLSYYRPQRSWGKVIFSQASVILSTGGACVVAGGVRGCWGACVVVGGCVVARGHAWLPGGMCGCQGACVVMWGVCMVVGGMCGSGGHAWWLEGGMRGIQRDTVNKQAVRILLECILVLSFCHPPPQLK